MLQGSQLAALTQARAAGQAGGQPKVLTIQLQVQQQPNQQGGVKVRMCIYVKKKYLFVQSTYLIYNISLRPICSLFSQSVH